MSSPAHSLAARLCTALLLLYVPLVVPALDPPREDTARKSLAPASGPRQLDWEELLPLAEREKPFESSPRMRPLFDDESGPPALQEGSAAVNRELNGVEVRIPGFVVPLSLDENVLVTAFLLVPYFGACIHVPPPPPNQMVYVRMKSPFRLATMYEPVWVIGKMSTKSASTKLADAAYTLAGVKIEKYEDW